jgi:UDPglucose 6-dehydrogenase
MRAAVIGLGKLGAPLAAVLASKGHEVIAVDRDPERVRLLAAGKAPVEEPQLQSLIDAARMRLRATTSFAEAVRASEVSFVIVPTPSRPDGAFSSEHVLAAVKEIGAALRGQSAYHVVTITSTLMPGTTGSEVRAALEASSGRRVGGDLGLCYNPEFVALGSVVRDMLFPDVLLIGESDARAGDLLAGIYAPVCERNPPVQRMSLVNAEITKIAVNTFVTTKITYANMLSGICERLEGADVDVVTATLGLDTRIGRKYLQGATGYGGPCFPRDNLAFSVLAHRVGARADLAESTDRLNRFQVERLFEIATARLPKGATVGLLGLSYKPDTAVIEESQGVALAQRLADAGYRALAFDPAALPAAQAALGSRLASAESAEACVRNSDRLVVTTAWPQFRDVPTAAFARTKGRLEVIDCWRLLDPARLESVCSLVYLGKGRHG